MALTKETELFQIDSNATTGAISVRVDSIVKEDGVEISRTTHRHCVVPYSSSKNAEGVWTHSETDVSDQDSKVQDIATTLWTDEVKQNFKDRVESESLT